MKKILLVVVGILVFIVVVVLIVGLLTPADHQASRTLRLKQSPDAVWAAINDHANESSWRDDVASVTSAGERNGKPIWQENYKDGNTIQLMTTESRQPNRMVREIAEEGPFSGRWEIDITPAGGGSSVKITEIGKVSNPFFRFVSK